MFESMAEVHFYHLTRSSLDQALPALLQKTYDSDLKAVVVTSSAEHAEYLTQHLWTFEASSFLPHGNANDKAPPEGQPIWLTHLDERPNKAQVLFLVDGAQSARMAEYQRVCDIFDGRDKQAVAEARLRFKAAQQAGHTLTYWQQGERGWEKK